MLRQQGDCFIPLLLTTTEKAKTSPCALSCEKENTGSILVKEAVCLYRYDGDGASHLSHLSYCGDTPGVSPTPIGVSPQCGDTPHRFRVTSFKITRKSGRMKKAMFRVL